MVPVKTEETVGMKKAGVRHPPPAAENVGALVSPMLFALRA
jgi:hypothetical protein